MKNLFGYYIDFDERGEFRADVRNVEGETVYEIDGFQIFEDGFMRHKYDLDGLTEYLRDLRIIPRNAEVLPDTDFERRVYRRSRRRL